MTTETITNAEARRRWALTLLTDCPMPMTTGEITAAAPLEAREFYARRGGTEFLEVKPSEGLIYQTLRQLEHLGRVRRWPVDRGAIYWEAVRAGDDCWPGMDR